MMFTNEMRLVFLDSFIVAIYFVCVLTMVENVYRFILKKLNESKKDNRGCLDKYKSVSK